MSGLPKFAPMELIQITAPFDDQDFLYEVKFDGFRALAYVEDAGYRLVSRHGLALDGLFPELAGIGDLPPGTLLDGELVVLRRGRPDLSLVQSRHQLRSAHKIRLRAQTTPATYIVFDQLYDAYRPLLGRPLAVRRDILGSTLGRAGSPRLVFSQGVRGAGRAFFGQVVDRQLEGVVAKRLDSLYRPGRREGAWIKIKPSGSKSLANFGGDPGKDR